VSLLDGQPLLGLVREMVFVFLRRIEELRNRCFVIAFRIPNLLRDLFAEGALSSAFVTVFSDYLVTKMRRRVQAFDLSQPY